MESHPLYADSIKRACEKYPENSAAAFQALCDLTLAQKWQNLAVLDLRKCKRAALRGKHPTEGDIRTVVPCTLDEKLTIEWFNNVFGDLTPPPKEIYVGLMADDSSMVYYKISKGIVKPPI